MRLIRFLLWALAGVALLAFALSNRQRVAVGYFPFTHELIMPLFIPVFIALALGALAAWFFLLSFRFRAFREHWRDAKRIHALESELASYKAQETTQCLPHANGDIS